ncbi:MAG TPA: hypothetical protein VGU61_19820 [Noviherbaspirillum sp.]|jgi:hypothetical protein|uniref:hypothetical protein n=1 Tax=Noviherbaspirillum sp. TaxID=1926288 RepID=UPI002DDCA7A0|nr:hypothetical protein [Noviherbaspirillum sp.]HEV2612520.1 hypothetical protein [Noviherbaspirillum sp.]
MANPWFRVWGDMVNDPKWRTIARKSGQKIGDVIAVYMHMLTCASSAEDRGHTEGWCDEDVATALDIDTEQVEAIREAMQGRVLDGDYLTGWEKRQPKREREDDTAAERKRQQRAREANQDDVTPCHAMSHQKQPREEEIREEEKKEEKSKAKASAAPRARKPTKLPLPADFAISDDVRQWATSKGYDRIDEHFESFVRKARANGYTYVDWDQALQNAIADDWAKLRTAQPRASPVASRPEKFDPTAYVNRPRTQHHERTIEIDATGEPV